MKKHKNILAFIGRAIAICSAEAAWAQDDPYQYLTATKPALSTIDQNGVDLVSGKATIDIPLLSFSGDFTSLGLKFSITLGRDDISGAYASVAHAFAYAIENNFIFREGSFISDNIGSIGSVTTPVGSGMMQTDYSKIVKNPDGSYYSPSIGPVHIIYMSDYLGGDGYYTADGARVRVGNLSGYRIWNEIIFPNGEIWHQNFQRIIVSGVPYNRLRSVSSNRGAVVEIEYASDVAGSIDWMVPVRALSFNRSEIYCDENAGLICSNPSTALDYVDFIYNDSERSVLVRRKGHAHGRKLTFAMSSVSAKPVSLDLERIEFTEIPDSAVSYTLATAGSDSDGYVERYVSSVSKGNENWNYISQRFMEEGRITAYSQLYSYGPDGYIRQASGNLAFGAVENISEPLNRNYSQGLDSYIKKDFRIIADTAPEGNGRVYERDARNNITKLTFIPKAGSSEQPIELSATYPSACTNPKICNRPLTVTDGNQATTMYAYAPEHGGILTKTMPTVNGVAPVIRFRYEQRYPWLRNATGSYSPGQPIWVLMEQRTCRTSATVEDSCAGGAADEVVTSYDYGPNAGPNNLLPRGASISADGQTLRTCYANNQRGDRISETSPRAGLISCP